MAAASSRTGSREERRARVERTALELFRARGFDRVTVQDVCAGAGVAPATFYRQFGTKEEVVFAYRDGFAAALQEALDAAVAVPEAGRLPVVLSGFARFLQSQQDMLAARDQIVLGHPRLMQRTLAVQRDLEAELAAGLARLRGLPTADTRALLEAGAGLLVLRVAVRSWRRGAVGSLVEATAQVLEELQDLLTPAPS
jgi:AcrR family transcriptional regulator